MGDGLKRAFAAARATNPIGVSDTCWLYSERDGMAVVIEKRNDDGSHVMTLQQVIPWKSVEKALSARPKTK